MSIMRPFVRCYAEGYGNRWEAVCLDFDIAVQGETFEAVVSSLHEAVELYIETLAELPETDRARLLRRQAPLSIRLRFLWHTIRSVFPGGDKPNHKYRAEFEAPLATA
jgi:hypothetical protein